MLKGTQEQAEQEAKRISAEWPGKTTLLYAIRDDTGYWTNVWSIGRAGYSQASDEVLYGVFRCGAMVDVFPFCKDCAARQIAEEEHVRHGSPCQPSRHVGREQAEGATP